MLQIILTNTHTASEIIAYRGLSPIFEKRTFKRSRNQKMKTSLSSPVIPLIAGRARIRACLNGSESHLRHDPKFQTIEIEKMLNLPIKSKRF